MQTPYEILAVPEDADDKRIKAAYLGMVKRYPPERFPDEFKKIYRAYELVMTEELRLKYRLFHYECPTPADLAAMILTSKDEQSHRPAPNDFKKCLAGSIRSCCANLKLK